MALIDNGMVKTGQEPTRARIQAVAPFALVMLQLDSLDFNAWFS
jgi:hypothetical protein